MTFTPNIPQATDDPSVSQGQILSNFQVLNNVYGTIGDHYPWTDTNGGEIGKHAKVTFPGLPTATAPGNVLPTPLAGNNAMFGQTQSGITMPYYRRDGFTTTYAVSPIKAYVSCIVTSTTAGTILDSFGFNLTSITTTGVTTKIVLHFINPMRNATSYGMLLSNNSNNTSTPSVDSIWYINQDASNTAIYLRTPTFPITFTAAALEF
jgi:hypothetical protein